jgi:hypothetical protein
MRRLVCVIEGHGERESVPVLCNRVIRGLLGVSGDWFVDEEPIRQPRSKLVDESVKSPKRPCHADGIRRALAIAAARSPDGVLVLCDVDDDCPATWGPSVPRVTTASGGAIAVAAVMASREYESWLLWGASLAERTRAKAVDPERSPRDAKKALRVLVPEYTPTTHQLEQTRALDLQLVWALSDSFDKFVRSIATVIQVTTPVRPKP